MSKIDDDRHSRTEDAPAAPTAALATDTGGG